MTSPQVPLRPAAPAAHRLADLATVVETAVAPGSSAVDGAASGVVITGAAVASADVRPGDLFIAVPGERSHGARFVADAVAAGAVAVLTDAAGARLLAGEGEARPAVPVLVVSDPRASAGAVSAWVFDHPAASAVTVGITGTNGKTTTSYLVDAALRSEHTSTGLFGTVETRIGDHSTPSVRTTVEAPALQRMFARVRDENVTAVTMEVSSHALALGRVNGVVFDVVGFTNLQRDHLDFHGDMEHYFRAKAELFTPAHARRGVVVVDDEWGRRLAREASIDVQTLATGLGAGTVGADWTVTQVTTATDGVGSSFVLSGPNGVSQAATSLLPGAINVANAALAIVLAHRAGVALDAAAQAVAGARGVPGRMERVVERGAGRPLAIVDYAHTPDALALALQAVRPVTPGRLVVVFGAGGDRDRGKRALMGRAAADGADVVVVTDDNPRSEDPAAIRAEVLAGAHEAAPRGQEIVEVEGRAEAIRRALDLAHEEDTIVVAGKGHESTQEIAGTTYAFSDQQTLRTIAVSVAPGSRA